MALGTTSKMWSDLFLADGGVINFNNGIFSASPSNIASIQVFDNVSTGRLQIAYDSASGVNILNRNDNEEIGVAGNYSKMRYWSTDFIFKEFLKLLE